MSKIYHRANADQKLRDRYEYQMSVRLEENSRLKAAKDKGRSEGRSEGKEKKAGEMDRDMYADGMSIEKCLPKTPIYGKIMSEEYIIGS